MHPSLLAPIYPPSLLYPSLHFTKLLDNRNTFTFPSVHHVNHFPNPPYFPNTFLINCFTGNLYIKKCHSKTVLCRV
jgi:hypothetical protein